MDVIQKSVLDPLQPYLRPVVEAIPEPVHDAVISLIGAPCHSALLLDLSLTKDPACTSLAISKALGIAIVGASAVVKVPQILKLINSRSSAGVSFVSYALETASLLITLSYGVRNQFPFSTYGESALIAVQDIAVGVLVLNFAGKPAAAAAFVAVVAASVYALLFDQSLIDAQTMSYLQAGAGALGIASKVPQIYAIWSQGGTGQLSAFAVCGLFQFQARFKCVTNFFFFRSSTISSVPYLASSLLSKRSMTSSFSTGSSPGSPST
jgi:mannose-P-dolichol utilization defect protein 1